MSYRADRKCMSGVKERLGEKDNFPFVISELF